MYKINQNLAFSLEKVHFIKKKDLKIGKSWVFNKLAGCSTFAFNDTIVKGSCGDGVPCWNTDNDGNLRKNGCYCGKAYQLYVANCIASHAINTIGIREHLAFVQQKLNLCLKRARSTVLVRIHQSGELESAQELLMWVNIALNNPRHTFGIYTKRIDIVKQVLYEIEQFPPNFTMNISVWERENNAFAREFVDLKLGNAFGVLANTEDINSSIVTDCPAYRGGKLHHEITCDVCGKCYRNGSKYILCNLH